MRWFRWKLWRFAWSLNADAAVIDGDGQWHPLIGNLMWLVQRRTQCQHEGCDAAGNACFITSDLEDGLTEYYCSQHAASHGYCPMCGDFWGGIGTFEMNGVCDHCKDELDADDYPDDDYENNEPVGSCENCDSNIYPDEDDGSGLCDQCQWHAAGCPQPGDSTDEDEEDDGD